MQYKLKVYKRTKESLAPLEYKAISPLGTAPCITDGDLHLSESNAIIDYILDEAEANSSLDTKNLRPKAGTIERVDFLFWFHASLGSFQAIMSMDSVFRLLPKRLPWPLSALMVFVASKVHDKLIDPRLSSIFGMAEQQLSHRDYLAANTLTAADISCIYSFDAALVRMPHYKKTYPSVAAWHGRILELPSVQRALEKIGQTSISYEA